LERRFWSAQFLAKHHGALDRAVMYNLIESHGRVDMLMFYADVQQANRIDPRTTCAHAH
jgi:hypothetical protein